MKEVPSLTLVSSDGSRVGLPLLPETLVRTRTADGSERLEFVAALDDRLGDGASTAATISALAALSDVGELFWGQRRFRGRLAELAITETAFREDHQPIAATIRVAFDVTPEKKDPVSVTVSGERWRRVGDLSRAGPDDPIFAAELGDDGSLRIRFGDGKRGARPPPGEVLVRAQYRVGGGRAGAG